MVPEQRSLASIERLFASWYAPLVRYGCRVLGDLAVAEDLAQEAFLELHRALQAGQQVDYPRAWTLTVMRRLVVRYLKEKRNWSASEANSELLEQLPDPHVFSEGFDLGDDLHELLSVLTPREEEVILLRLDALKYREIAAQLGISVNSVNTLLARALRKLQKWAGQRGNGPRTQRRNDAPRIRQTLQ